MNHPVRLLAAGVAACFGTAVLAPLATHRAAPPSGTRQPALLAAAYAAPAEISSTDTLARGETVSELLERARVNGEEAAALITALQERQNVRALRPGATVEVRKRAADGAVRGVAVHLDADRTLELRGGGGEWLASVAEVPVRTDTAVLTGEVRTSLYQALLEGEGAGVPRGERAGIADVLADRIFAWQVDFSRDLRPGDPYRIVVERMVRPDGSARSLRVLAARFRVNGTEHDAFWFRASNGDEDYFDHRGDSLRRAFLRAPLEFRRISSRFSAGRFHPVLHRVRAHQGVDYAARSGTPVRAVGDGTVARAGRAGGYGNLVEIRHGRGYSTRYGHLRAFADGVRPGARVSQGQVIGYVGMTGLATGPHLHYEFHSGGRAVDPTSERVRKLTGDPVPERQRARFRRLVEAYTAQMNGPGGVRLAAGAAAVGEAGGD